MEVTVPEKVALLYESNDAIEKIQALFDEGHSVQQILNRGTFGSAHANTSDDTESSSVGVDIAELDIQRTSLIPVVAQNYVATIDVPHAAVTGPTPPNYRHRLLRALSLITLVGLSAGTSFWAGAHFGNRSSRPLEDAWIPVSRGSSPAIEEAYRNARAVPPVVQPLPTGATASASQPASVRTDTADLPAQTAWSAAPLKPQPANAVPTSNTAPQIKLLQEDQVADLLRQGDALFAAHDLASARLFYERAADAGDALAALRLGESYDPAFLAQIGMNGMRGDITTAKRWYWHAAELGSSEAKLLFEQNRNE